MFQYKTVTGPLPDQARVLVLDDERFDRHRLGRLCAGLKPHFDVSNVASLAELATILEADTFDLIFVDYGLPDGTGLDALELIRLSPRNCTAATILITGMGRDDIAIAAMDAGCSDYIPKETLTKTAFKRAVTNALNHSTSPARSVGVETTGALHNFARACAMDLKPMVSRMLRQIRDLRHGDTGKSGRTAEELETSCNLMWDYLVALQEMEGHPVIRAAESKTAASAVPKPSRPPSPFRRTP